jgi:hypothetical protein
MDFEGKNSIRNTLLMNIEYNEQVNYGFLVIYKIITLSVVFLWVLNLVFNVQGRKPTDSVWEQGAEQNIWT